LPATLESKSDTSTPRQGLSGSPTKIDLACGQNCQEGFHGVDVEEIEGVQQVDLLSFPWPFESDSVDELFSSHFVEHIPHDIPGQDNDGLVLFMEECYRILKHEGTVRLIHPHAMSSRAFQDPYHRRFIPEATWWYFNREWREANKLDHYPITSNYNVDNIVASLMGDWGSRAQSAQTYATLHYINVMGDLDVYLSAQKEQS
jgi:predicted SAM-dependent methyltransferase